MHSINNSIPLPSIERLCKVYQICQTLEQENIKEISSRQLGKELGIGAHNIRKDINYLGGIGTSGYGYEISKLKHHISQKFGFGIERFLMELLDIQNIRECILFPRDRTRLTP